MGKVQPIIEAILAAALYAASIPFAKLILTQIDPFMLAGFLYLGAGLGMAAWIFFQSRSVQQKPAKNSFTQGDLFYLIGMVVLDIFAPILLMFGVRATSSATASVLNNLEIVMTALIAWIFFREKISLRLWLGLIFVIIAGVLVSATGEKLELTIGALYILGATACWGLENNFTRALAERDSRKIVLIKGLGSGTGAIALGLLAGESFPFFSIALLTMIVGYLSYGLSINFYIQAQKTLGAAKTSAFYAINPFISVLLSMIFLKERPLPIFYTGVAAMTVGTIFIVLDTLYRSHAHKHLHVHAHLHVHNQDLHYHEHVHVHTHQHGHVLQEDQHAHLHRNLPGHDHLHGE